jgi:hypothetical protein
MVVEYVFQLEYEQALGTQGVVEYVLDLVEKEIIS